MTDEAKALVDRLRRAARDDDEAWARQRWDQAADLIEAQAREIERLREALKTADAWLDRWARHIGDCPGIDGCECGLTRARYEAETTLASIEGAGHE